MSIHLLSCLLHLEARVGGERGEAGLSFGGLFGAPSKSLPLSNSIVHQSAPQRKFFGPGAAPWPYLNLSKASLQGIITSLWDRGAEEVGMEVDALEKRNG